MHILKKAALGLGTTLLVAGSSVATVPAAHAAPAAVGGMSALRFKLDNEHTCVVSWTDKRKDVLFEIKEKDLATGDVRKAVYTGSVRQAAFNFRHPDHRFRYSIRVSKGGEVSTWKSDVCEKA